MCKSELTVDKPSLIGAFSGHVNHKKIGSSSHITGTAEAHVVTFCTQVGYINSSNRMTYHQQRGRGYGHGTVLKFLLFVLIQRVARICQRQLSYWLHLALPFISL